MASDIRVNNWQVEKDAGIDLLPQLTQLPIDDVHVDVVAEPTDLAAIDQIIADDWVLSAGCVNGCNIWQADLAAVYQKLAPIYANRGGNLWLAPSCSLLHCLQDLDGEENINPLVKEESAACAVYA